MGKKSRKCGELVLCHFFIVRKATNKIAYEDDVLSIQKLQSFFRSAFWLETKLCINDFFFLISKNTEYLQKKSHQNGGDSKKVQGEKKGNKPSPQKKKQRARKQTTPGQREAETTPKNTQKKPTRKTVQ